GVATQRLEQASGPGIHRPARASYGSRLQTGCPPARRNPAGRRNHLAVRDEPAGRPFARLCRESGRQLVGLPAGLGQQMDPQHHRAGHDRSLVMSSRVFDPTVSPAAPVTFSYAPRPESLRGLRVGLVENTKFNSEVILRKIAERLAARYQISMTHLDHKK